MIEKFRQFIYNQHDNVCNQKYADTLPYSTHLGFAEAQGDKFMKLLVNEPMVTNPDNYRARDVRVVEIIRYALIAHDCIEDARMTYNNLVKKCEDLDNYYAELKENKYAVFVKLADLAANTLFSKLSGSDMYKKYKKEWPSFKEKVYIEEYKEFFDYVENL